MSGANGTDSIALAATPSQMASTSAVTLDTPGAVHAPVKSEDSNVEDAQLFASLVSGMQDGAAAAAIAAATPSNFMSSMPMLSSLAAPPQADQEDRASPIQAYAKLEFPGFSYYIQTLDFTIGRRPAEFRAKIADEQHITGRSKSAGDVDVDLGPLKSISRFHVRIFYQDQSASSASSWNGTGTNGAPASQGAISPPFGQSRSMSVSSSGRGSSYDFGDRTMSRRSSQGRFVLQVLGRNGACVDDVYVGMGAIVPLGKRTKIQIAERVFYFVLPPAHSHMIDSSAMGALEDEEIGSEVSLGSSDEEESDNDDTSGTATDAQSKPSGRRKLVLKQRADDSGKPADSAQVADGDDSKASIANRKRKRGEPLDEEETKALKVGTPIGVEALNTNKKKKNDASATSAQSVTPTPPRAPTGMAAIAIAALAAKDAADAAKAKGMPPGKPLANAMMTPSKGALPNPSAMATHTPMSEMPLPPAGPGIKPDKADLDLVREAMSCQLANSRGGKLTLHEIYDYLMETYEYFKNNGRFNGRDWHSGIRTAISRAPIMVRIDRKADEPGYGVFYAFGTSEAAIAARAERGQPLDAPGEISRSPSPPMYPFPFPMPMSAGPTPGGIPYMPSHMHGMMPGLMPPMGMPPMTPQPGSMGMSMMPGAMNPALGLPMGASMPSIQAMASGAPSSKATATPSTPSTPLSAAQQTRPRPPPSTPKTNAKPSVAATPSSASAAQSSPTPRTATNSPAIAADGRVRIVVGKAPPDALAQMAAAPKAAITQSIEALFGGPPIVHHEGTLFLSPVVFGKMSAQEINDIGGKGAQQALATLQAQLVAHLQSKMAAGLDPSQSSPSPGPSDSGTARPSPKPGVGRPPLANSAARPASPATVNARPVLGRPAVTANNAGRPVVRPTDSSIRPQSTSSSTTSAGITARPGVSTAAGTSIGRPAINRPPLASSVPRPIGAGLARPGRPPLQRPPSATIPRPSTAPLSTSTTTPSTTSSVPTSNGVRPMNGAASSTISRPTQGTPSSGSTLTQRPPTSARPLARPSLSRPPLNSQRPIGQASGRPAAGRPPLSARPRAAAPPGQQPGRPAGIPSKTTAGDTVARPSTSATTNLTTPATAPTTAATPVTVNAPAASSTASASPSKPSPSAATNSTGSSSADMAGLLALLAGGKLDSSKLTPAQHELLQRAGRLAAEQQQRAQQQKAAAAAAAAAATTTATTSSSTSPSAGQTKANASDSTPAVAPTASTEKTAENPSTSTSPAT